MRTRLTYATVGSVRVSFDVPTSRLDDLSPVMAAIKAFSQGKHIEKELLDRRPADSTGRVDVPDIGGERTDTAIPSYVISTLFLRECYSFLMKREEEILSYVSGVSVAGVRILDAIIPFVLDQQEVTYVRGDLVSSTAALIHLSERELELLGTLHSHPGEGEGATTPSNIDRDHHRRLERGRHRALGIIMTRDGHVRFYSNEMPFIVRVIGADAQRVRDDVYRLILDFKPPE